MRQHIAGLALSLLFPALVPAQSPSATQVVAFDDMGQAGGGIFNPQNLLGAPDGLVCSLGIGGWAILGFDVTITDGPGADLIVAENAFYTGPTGSAFCEVLFVEVSTDGVNFARIPSAYYGPPVSPGPFAAINVGTYGGFGGATPAAINAPDPQDVVRAGGDAFDLADLAAHPLVTAGIVDLHAIHYVKLVDARDGIDADSRGVLVRDTGGGSADPDGVTAIHHTGNLSANGPTVDVVIPANGQFSFTVEDPDGWTDLDLLTLRLSLFGIEVPLINLISALQVTRFDAQGFTFQLAGPLPPWFLLSMAVSVQDIAGHHSGDSRTRPVN